MWLKNEEKRTFSYEEREREREAREKGDHHETRREAEPEKEAVPSPTVMKYRQSYDANKMCMIAVFLRSVKKADGC